MGDGRLNNPVFYAVPKLIRLRSDCEALNFGKNGGGAKTLKDGTEFSDGVIKIRKYL
jgi:hypothetical protein